MQKLQQHFHIVNTDYTATWPSVNPQNCIDYIAVFRKEEVQFQSSSVNIIADSIASDHRPVSTQVSLF